MARGRGAGWAALLLLAWPWGAGAAGAQTAAERPQEPVGAVPYRVEEVRFVNRDAGITLAGTLTLPEGEGPFPAVALVSGSGPQDRDSELFGHRSFLVLADGLTRRGIAVLRADDRGVGASEGDFGEATTRDFAADAAAGAAWLRERPDIRDDAVGLVGMSEGGLAAPLAAVEWGGVDFLVLLGAPGVTGREVLLTQSALVSRAMGAPEEQLAYNRAVQDELFDAIVAEEDPAARARRMAEVLGGQFARLSDEERAAAGLTPDVQAEWIQDQVAEMGGPWFRFFLLHDPLPVLRRVEVPVLAVNGSLDLQVPPEPNLRYIADALRDGGNPDVTAVELPGLNHLLQTARVGVPAEYPQIAETLAPEVMDRVAEWIGERFR